MCATTLASLLVDVEAELGGDDDLVTDGCKRLADQFFIGERPIGLGCIEQRDAALMRCADQVDHLLPVCRWTIEPGHAHAAEPERRDFKAGRPEFACGHHGDLHQNAVFDAVMAGP